MITIQEIRASAVEVMRDHRENPPSAQIQQLKEAKWVSDPSDEIWLPPEGTEPYRPYQRYSAWKQMRKMADGSR